MVSKLVVCGEAGLSMQKPHKMKYKSLRYLKQNINVIQNKSYNNSDSKARSKFEIQRNYSLLSLYQIIKILITEIIVLFSFTFNLLLWQREFGSQKFEVRKEATAILLSCIK